MRKSLIILGAVLAAPASAQSTDCRWLGSTWSCNTQPTINTPSSQNDYLGAMGGPGPDYNDTMLKQQQIQQNRNIIEMQEAQLRAMKRAEEGAADGAHVVQRDFPSTPVPPPISITFRYGINMEQREMLDGLLKSCPIDDQGRVPLDTLPESQRALSSAMCYAFDAGRMKQLLLAMDD